MKNIRLGNHYNKFLNNLSYNHEKIQPEKDCKESYLITNKPNAQLFKAKLNVLNDGRAILKANYTSYSGVKNKFISYFDRNGNEIIHSNNSTRVEKKYFDSIIKTL